MPGDGKFDQTTLPSRLELTVGRVDLSRLTKFGADSDIETLTRRYIAKDIAFRTAASVEHTYARRGFLRVHFDNYESGITPVRFMRPIVGQNLTVVGSGEIIGKLQLVFSF